MAFEGPSPQEVNPFIHTMDDVIGVPGWSWEHTHAFTKLAVAFAYELGVN